MRLSAAVADLVDDLQRLGRLGDESTSDAAGRLAAAMAGPMRARLVELASLIAAEISGTMPDGHAEVRLVGDDVTVVVLPGEPVAATEPVAGADLSDDTDARVTLRLPATLKGRLERAAADEGLSLNSHIVRLLGQPNHAMSTNLGGARRRLSGYGHA